MSNGLTETLLLQQTTLSNQLGLSRPSVGRASPSAAGLTPGGQGSVNGLACTWPNSPSGRPDTASATGQTVELSSPAAKLSFLGSAVNGNQQTRTTVTYGDGTTDSIVLRREIPAFRPGGNAILGPEARSAGVLCVLGVTVRLGASGSRCSP
ncbi:hypothetical protein QF035_003058 [Streptomyces umbrinus]|uniref:Uncharacterized protein n=1 Tax=Streptomyces umbrinus TaxID=67370 RepID=A0ABU0SPS8_9ACTN|nr:hypothetical protein [Streptomyces umbrinus]